MLLIMPLLSAEVSALPTDRLRIAPKQKIFGRLPKIRSYMPQDEVQEAGFGSGRSSAPHEDPQDDGFSPAEQEALQLPGLPSPVQDEVQAEVNVAERLLPFQAAKFFRDIDFLRCSPDSGFFVLIV